MGFRDSLAREIANGPIAAAVATRDAVRADFEGALTLIDDPNEEPTWRVAALLAVALAAEDGLTLPDAVIDLLDDDLLVDAVIAWRAEAALTGILATPHASERARKYIAVRLAAAGSTGFHVAALQFSVEDFAAAGRAALPALVTGVRAHAGDDDMITALASIVATWTRAQPAFGERLCAALPVDVAHALAPAARHFDATTADLLAAVR